jgi:predicted esterase
MSSTVALDILRGLLVICAAILTTSLKAESQESSPLQPGQDVEITLAINEVPPTLYSMMNGTTVPARLTAHLPDDYSSSGSYPLVLYVPGNDGGPRGNLYNAKTIAGPRGWIAATLPLFKKSIDRDEPAGGVIVSFEDYPVLSKAFATLLGKLYERIPNIDRDRSTMVGFSNGAITIGVLVSNHDEFILSHFRNFCLVDHGMFHLMDLHKRGTRDARYLLLVGDQEEFGRQLKIRQSQLQQDAWKLLNVDVTHRILTNTGHEFNDSQMEIVRDWLHGEVASGPTTKPQ